MSDDRRFEIINDNTVRIFDDLMFLENWSKELVFHDGLASARLVNPSGKVFHSMEELDQYSINMVGVRVDHGLFNFGLPSDWQDFNPKKLRGEKTSELPKKIEKRQINDKQSGEPPKGYEAVVDSSLPMGWKKLKKQRQNGKCAGKWDVYIQSPLGTKFSCKKTLIKHVQCHQLRVDVDCINFRLASIRSMVRQHPHTDIEDSSTAVFTGPRKKQKRHPETPSRDCLTDAEDCLTDYQERKKQKRRPRTLTRDCLTDAEDYQERCDGLKKDQRHEKNVTTKSVYVFGGLPNGWKKQVKCQVDMDSWTVLRFISYKLVSPDGKAMHTYKKLKEYLERNQIKEDLSTFTFSSKRTQDEVRALFGQEKRERNGRQGINGQIRMVCTVCHMNMERNAIRRHPVLRVAMCSTCFTWYMNPLDPITKDAEGQDEQCLWCGDGEQIICCDTCSHSICHTCIGENIGRGALLKVLDESIQWSCYICNPSPIEHFVAECNSMLQNVERPAVEETCNSPTVSYTTKRVDDLGTSHGVKRKESEEVVCTACQRIIKSDSEARSHPSLHLIVCERCYKKVTKRGTDTTQRCQLCGKLQKLIGCSSCSEVFCRLCIKRLSKGKSAIKQGFERWECLVCTGGIATIMQERQGDGPRYRGSKDVASPNSNSKQLQPSVVLEKCIQSQVKQIETQVDHHGEIVEEVPQISAVAQMPDEESLESLCDPEVRDFIDDNSLQLQINDSKKDAAATDITTEDLDPSSTFATILDTVFPPQGQGESIQLKSADNLPIGSSNKNRKKKKHEPEVSNADNSRRSNILLDASVGEDEGTFQSSIDYEFETREFEDAFSSLPENSSSSSVICSNPKRKREQRKVGRVGTVLSSYEVETFSSLMTNMTLGESSSGDAQLSPSCPGLSEVEIPKSPHRNDADFILDEERDCGTACKEGNLDSSEVKTCTGGIATFSKNHHKSKVLKNVYFRRVVRNRRKEAKNSKQLTKDSPKKAGTKKDSVSEPNNQETSTKETDKKNRIADTRKKYHHPKDHKTKAKNVKKEKETRRDNVKDAKNHKGDSRAGEIIEDQFNANGASKVHKEIMKKEQLIETSNDAKARNDDKVKLKVKEMGSSNVSPNVANDAKKNQKEQGRYQSLDKSPFSSMNTLEKGKSQSAEGNKAKKVKYKDKKDQENVIPADVEENKEKFDSTPEDSLQVELGSSLFGCKQPVLNGTEISCIVMTEDEITRVLNDEFQIDDFPRKDVKPDENGTSPPEETELVGNENVEDDNSVRLLTDVSDSLVDEDVMSACISETICTEASPSVENSDQDGVKTGAELTENELSTENTQQAEATDNQKAGAYRMELEEEEELDYFDDLPLEELAETEDAVDAKSDNPTGDEYLETPRPVLRSPPSPSRLVTPSRMAGKILNYNTSSTPVVQDVCSTQCTTVSSTDGQTVRSSTSTSTTHLLALSNYSKRNRTQDFTTEKLAKCSKRRQSPVKNKPPEHSQPTSTHVANSTSRSQRTMEEENWSSSDDEEVEKSNPNSTTGPRKSCREDVVAVRNFISKGMWQKFVNLYLDVTARRRLLTGAEITDITKAFVRKNAVNDGYEKFVKLLLSGNGTTRIDLKNVSNIGVDIMLSMEADTCSEDALFVLRTLIKHKIEFQELAKSPTLPQAKIVELAVKYFLDSEDESDRARAIELLNRTNWPQMESVSHQVKLVKSLLNSATDVKSLSSAAKGFRWLYTTYIYEDNVDVKDELKTCYHGLCKRVERISQNQHCGNICIFLFKIFTDQNSEIFDLRPKVLRLFFRDAYDSWKENPSQKLTSLVKMLDCNFYPTRPQWQVNRPCIRAKRNAVQIWNCMSRREIHIQLLAFLQEMSMNIREFFDGNCRIDRSVFQVDIWTKNPPQQFWSIFDFNKNDDSQSKSFKVVQEVLGDDLKPPLKITRLEDGFITLGTESVETYLTTMHVQEREVNVVLRKRPASVTRNQSEKRHPAKVPKLQTFTNHGPGILGSPPKGLTPLASLRTFQTGILGEIETSKIHTELPSHIGGVATSPTFNKSTTGGLLQPLSRACLPIASTTTGRQGLRGMPIGRGAWNNTRGGLPHFPALLHGTSGPRIPRGSHNQRMPRGHPSQRFSRWPPIRGVPGRAFPRGVARPGLVHGSRGTVMRRGTRGIPMSRHRGNFLEESVVWLGGS